MIARISDRPPVCSVIVPVRNEATRIAACVRAIRETSNRYPVEVIVVDGQSSDRTVDAALSAEAIVIASPVVGRGAQMHWGARCAIGEVLIFLHADTILPATWQECIARPFFHDRVPPAAAAFRVAFDSTRAVYSLIAGLANLRAAITRLPHGDQALVVTRQAYFAAGGFPPVPLMEEYFLLPKLKRLGRVTLFPASVTTSCRRYERRSPLVTAIHKAALIALFYAGVSPHRLARWY